MRTCRLADLIGMPIVAADDRPIGRVVDLLLLDRDRDYQVLALEYGQSGWRRRLNITRLFLPHGVSGNPDRIAWSDVERVESGRIVLKT